MNCAKSKALIHTDNPTVNIASLVENYKTLVLAFLAAWTVCVAQTTQAQGRSCEKTEFENEAYIVCTVDMRQNRLEIFWRDPKGEAFGSISSLSRHLQAKGDKPLFLMNAGMYHAELNPVGLYVENGREFARASTTNGPGNFHLKPNGIFYVSGGKVGVLETGQYLRRGIKAEIATQSGPMLVINNRLHPRFPSEGVSRKVRNGVGVRDVDTAYFAISESAVTFTQFARLFRDKLKTPNALFLDGSVSSLSTPGLDRTGFRSLGPMIGAFEKTTKSNPKANLSR
jgi:uncharacterized protein YigE (DUF2233 family)